MTPPGATRPGRAVVAGAAGFIGSRLVDRLLDRGYEVLGLDNLSRGSLRNLAPALRHPAFRFAELDLTDVPRYSAVLRDAGPRWDIVWHMAANSDIAAGVADPAVDLRDTFLTTHGTLQVMRQLGIPRIAFASTSAIYGMNPGPLSEDTGPLFPVSNYGAMKLASEGAISAALESFLERVWIFRFPNVVGPRATHGVIYDLLRKLRHSPGELEVLGDGAQQKPYLHVSELIDAMSFIVDRAAGRLNYFNIGVSGPGTTVRYIAEAVVRAAAPGALIRYTGGSGGWVGDVPRFRYSIEKLAALGWRPAMTSDEAIDRAVHEIFQELQAECSL